MREQLRDFKKDRILEEAIRLFYVRGFRGTSLDSIAETLHMTKPFVYGVYERKTDILYDIFVRTLTMSVEAVEGGCKAPGSAAHRLGEVARQLAHVCITHRQAVTVCYREEASLEPEHLMNVNALKGRLDAQLAALLAEGAASGEFDIIDDRTASLAIGGMISWTYNWYKPDGRLSPEAIKDHMARYALRIAGARS